MRTTLVSVAIAVASPSVSDLRKSVGRCRARVANATFNADATDDRVHAVRTCRLYVFPLFARSPGSSARRLRLRLRRSLKRWGTSRIAMKRSLIVSAPRSPRM